MASDLLNLEVQYGCPLPRAQSGSASLDGLEHGGPGSCADGAADERDATRARGPRLRGADARGDRDGARPTHRAVRTKLKRKLQDESGTFTVSDAAKLSKYPWP